MKIQSSIDELELFDLFQFLNLHGKTGRLTISDGPDGKKALILFHEGLVSFADVYARAPRSAESLLVNWGVLSENALGRLERALPSYPSLVECLDGEGLAATVYLEKIVVSRVLDCVYEVLKWEVGTVGFTEEQFDERREILFPLNTEKLIFEGTRRIDEWSDIRAKVPSPHSIFKLCSSKKVDPGLNLEPEELEIISLIDGTRSVHEINRAVAGDLFATSKLISKLVMRNVVKLAENSVASEDDPDNDRLRIDTLIRRGHLFYKKLNLEKAATEFEKAVHINPDCFEALRMLGEIYYKADKPSDAMVYLRKARAARPENEKAMFLKGYLHAHLGEVSEAIKEWEELLAISSNPKIIEMIEEKISVAREWDKVLLEY